MSRSLSDAVAAVVAVFRRRPGDLLPLYVLGTAIPAVARVVPFFTAAVAYLHLETTGRLRAARDELAGIETTPPDPEADPAAFEAWTEELVPVVEQLLTPTTGALAAAAVLGLVLLVIVLVPIVSAAQLSACYGRLRGERGLIAGIAGGRRYALRFLALYVLEVVLWIVVIASVGAVVAALVGGFSFAGAPLAGALAALLAALVGIAAVAAVRAAFAFAPVAVVVDDASVFGSLSATASFVRARPVGAAFYYVIAIGSTVALSTVAGAFALLEVASLVPVLSTLLLLPALDLLKTALYCDHRGRLTPPATPDRSVWAQFRAGLGRGWGEMWSFVRATPLLHAAVVALALVGFWLGWRAAAPFVGVEAFEASISGRLEGHVPPAAALEFFGNNWMVALSTALSGIALAVPAVVSVLFNGAFFGIYARLEADPLELVAFVVPHGILEIPAIFIAGALGIYLGVAFWRRLRGRLPRVAFADDLERAFWVLVGVGILLAVAAAIEGFVSPYYYQPFL
ncbi:Stage II sporulation protein M [Halobiforma haloterrestris]|uniref:Stage II sporulation protein M n=1 Tax=Natronobacterium haloterrestre TaxID=148448 RepID=A0A1I1E5A3_NATHA|nr:stage II sporulation protein M [Halobiforma haloterrestris]SFB80043.1 Stage II sporulation protein M [Halobiforma haloterrestris]